MISKAENQAIVCKRVRNSIAKLGQYCLKYSVQFHLKSEHIFIQWLLSICHFIFEGPGASMYHLWFSGLYFGFILFLILSLDPL